MYDEEFLGTDLGTDLSPHFGDIDSDGDLDLLIGTYSGDVKVFENVGNKYEYEFLYHSTIQTDSNVWFSVPALYDIDSDSDLDIILGNIYGNLRLYKQDSPFSFNLDTEQIQDINVGYYSAPYFFDIDLDDDNDLILGGRDNHKIYFNNNNIFEETNEIQIPYLGKNVKFFGGSLFNSNQFDVISGVSTGGLYFLSETLCLQGDLNQDETINITDILILIDLLFNLQNKNSYYICSGNLDNNLGLNILDIINLIIKILEL